MLLLWQMFVKGRISERTSCEESANFLQILHIHPTLKTRISLKKVILTEVPGIRLSSNRSATFISYSKSIHTIKSRFSNFL